jgi:hypothetical protein
MAAPEPERHAFIVRLRLEETNERVDRRTWRGQVQHVPSGDQRSVRGLADLGEFIAAHVEPSGIRLGRSWRIRRWLLRRRGDVIAERHDD